MDPDLANVHQTWALWLQGPLVALTIAGTVRELARAFRRLGRGELILAALATVAVVVLLPPYMVSWGGHQEEYRKLLQGLAAEPDALETTTTFPLSAGLAWTLSRLGPLAEPVWLAGNRLALPLVLLCMAITARQIGGPRAGLIAAAGGCLAVPMLAWSTTAFAILPAMAAAGLGLVLAVHGRPFGAVAWLGLALASRLEWVGAVPGVFCVGAAWWWVHRTTDDRARWAESGASVAVAITVIGTEAWLLTAKTRGLPNTRPDPSVALENLANFPLGGPWFSWLVLGATALLLLLCWPPRLGTATGALWMGGLALTLLQLITPADLGARHFLPATLLLIPLVAAALDRAIESGQRLHRVMAAVVLLALLVAASRDLVDLRYRFLADEPGVLPRWVVAANAGPSGSPAEVLDPSCGIYLPGGSAVVSGALDSFDVGIVHEARQALDAGQCLQWAVRPEVRFSGDTQHEFLDRAVRTLELRPIGWLDGPRGRWLLMESR